MFSYVLTAAFAATLASPASAFIRFGCNNNLVEERADPIVVPGQVASHVHKIVGGSGFGFTMDYAQARASKCSSCPVKEDASNYWTPKLYYRYQNGSVQSVPTVGDNMADLNGGMTVYYLQRGPAADTKTLKAFPEGFRMLAGTSSKRNFTGDFAAQGISFACLGGNQPETNGLPNYNCPGGLRAQVFFPSCWDGVNLDSADHMSHMSYPASGNYNGGPCPTSHPVQLISLFFEILYDTNQFASMWYGNSQPFVFANGDPTGYGFHGDFVNGWDVPTLQNVVNDCDDLSAQGVLSACSAITTYTAQQQSDCRLPPQINEQVAGLLPALPGCNPVSPGPGVAPNIPVCAGAVAATIGSGPQYFTDMTSEGWAYAGCATDGSPRTLPDKTSVYSSGSDAMTVEGCISFCSGYAYAGLEYGGECWCGNALAADRAPQPGIFGSCNMKCKGNSTEYCGGPDALSLYQKCSGAACTNAGGLVGPVAPPAASIPASSPVQSGVPSGGIVPPKASSTVAPLPPKASNSKAPVPPNVSSAVMSSPPKVSTTVSPLGNGNKGVTFSTVTVTATAGACRFRG